MRESKLNKTTQAKKAKTKSPKAKDTLCNCDQLKFNGHPLLHIYMADIKVNPTPKAKKVKAKIPKASLIDRLAEAAKELSDSCGCGQYKLYYSEASKSKLDAMLAEFDKEKRTEAKDCDKERKKVEKAMKWAMQ